MYMTNALLIDLKAFYSYQVQPKGKGNVAPKKLEGGLQKHLILPFTKGTLFY